MAKNVSNRVLVNYVNKMLDQKRGADNTVRGLGLLGCSAAMAWDLVYKVKAERKQKKNNPLSDGDVEEFLMSAEGYEGAWSGKNVPRGTNGGCDCGGKCKETEGKGAGVGDDRDCNGYAKDGGWVHKDGTITKWMGWGSSNGHSGMSTDGVETEEDDVSDLMWAKAQLVEANKTIKNLQKRVGFENSIKSTIQSCIPTINPTPLALQKKNSEKTTISVCSQISDLHIGEIVRRDETEGLSDFNYSIAQKRMKTYMEKFDDWVDLHRKSYNVEEWAVLVTGDLINNYLHPENERTDEFPPPVQAIKAGELLSRTIASSAHKFPRVTVFFVVADNHSRLDRKCPSKLAGKNSMNYIVGNVAKSALEKHKNVTFNIYESIQEVVEVRKRKYLILHGHTVRGGSNPYLSAQKRIGKESYARMNMPDDKKFNVMVMGHYHAPMKCQDLIIGGNLPGSTEYDRGAGRHCESVQTAWCVSEKFGEFDFIEFWLSRDEGLAGYEK